MAYARTFLWVCLIFSFFISPATAKNSSLINCDIQNGPCAQTLANAHLTLEITPRPVTAMQDLTFRVTWEGAKPPKPPYIDLGMPGMKMGPNRVMLKETDPGLYEGKGIIVRCPSGKRVWYADVTIPDAGTIRFVFDVVY